MGVRSSNKMDVRRKIRCILVPSLALQIHSCHPTAPISSSPVFPPVPSRHSRLDKNTKNENEKNHLPYSRENEPLVST